MNERVGTVVVGAGPAGLATSARLMAAGHDHVVLEQGRIGDTWRTQRWDSFRLNTPGWMNGLADASGFGTAGDLVAALERRAERLPVREGVTVTGVWRRRGGGYLVATDVGVIQAQSVVAASGAHRVPYLPAIADAVSGRAIEHLHTADYRRPDELVDGGVLVVGASQSGAQIAEELLAAGRRVVVCTSPVARTPRVYRGREIMEWGHAAGMLDQPADQVDATVRRLPQLLIAPGRSLSLQSLARQGAELVGRLAGADGTRLRFGSDPVTDAAFADAAWVQIRAAIDEWIAATGTPAGECEPDEPALTHRDAPACAGLDLAAEGIGTVIWATGLRGDHGWLKLPLVDDHGLPLRRSVATASPGLYVLGLPWLTHRMSGGLYGIENDAVRVAGAIVAAERHEELALAS